MKDMWNAFLQDESGQGLVEYVLIIALVAIGLITVMVAFRGDVAQIFADIGATLDAAPGTQEAEATGTSAY